MDEVLDGPVVVAANWYRFRGAERITHARVRSVCVMWVLEGRGTVTSRGRTVELTPGAVLRLPWDHDVAYRADAVAPFRLGTVHVVPRHDHAVPVRPVVAHLPGDPALDAPERTGCDHHSAPVLFPSASDTARRVASLGRYVVERFAEGVFDEAVFRALGALVLAETGIGTTTETTPGTAPGGRAGADARARGSGPVPVALELMTAFATARLDRPVSVSDVARAGGCSTATAERLFTRHLGQSVSAWVRALRMREAATLLRTTGLRVGEVARTVGYDDPLYFSRAFRAVHGVPPSRYAAEVIRP